jgi:hypothetical protein
MVLTMNNFNSMDNITFKSPAMGTKVAPSSANLFMADFEDTYVFTYEVQPLLHVRFIDEIFLLFSIENRYTHLAPLLSLTVNVYNI